jgi:thioredoxin reductase (NADPH)
MDFIDMEVHVLVEKIVIYGLAGILFFGILWFYIWKQKRESALTEKKIQKAVEEGLFEPISLHPVVDPNSCIKSGACIKACPEEDIIGIVNGKARVINAARCIGHGACFNACPTQAITLCIGTEKRGVDLPHVNELFESNVPGLYIAGELGGMGLIRNAVEQGRQAVDNIARSINRKIQAEYDLIIVGAGPAGISASLNAHKHNLKTLTLEQDTLGGTVYTFPRSKVVMTNPMNLPLYGKVKFRQTNKDTLLKIWNEALGKNEIKIKEKIKVESIESVSGHFNINTNTGETFNSRKVLLSIGRRGTPRKLNVPGEVSQKVAYRLLEPENISGKNIMVVGGGDSAVESAMLLSENNHVSLSYRKDSFSRIKPENSRKIKEAMNDGKVDVLFNTQVKKIGEKTIELVAEEIEEPAILENDLVFVFIGGELPTDFLKKAGIEIKTMRGEALISHKG